ncbi:MFS transporter [Pseudaminobacter arsenicus]|uniref:MFS transporter n=1 Tax=Borborobacter arsenicus TaxID=1851146 RepID=A0A432VCN2_9HYPH|nr:MFS transporter [Pseudaminobacter arsenicus]RUM99922.1 MFS transporter [Pseudaminobacter arsenicus]
MSVVAEDAGPPRWAALAGVTAALSMFGVAQGLSYPLFTLLMQQQGLSPATIGLSAAMMPLGLILSASFVPKAVQVLGARALAVGCALLGSVCFFAIGFLQDWVAWFVIRFLLGLIINPLYILGEVWALALAPPARRGRVMGVFNALMGAGYAAGPLALAMTGINGWPPFLVGVGGFAACAAVLFIVSAGLPGFEAPKSQAAESDDKDRVGGVIWFASLAPALLVAVTVSSATQQSAYSMLPVFGAGYGLTAAALAALITALSAGNILLQIPLGLAAERFGGRAMVVACALTTAICALLLPSLILTPFIWPLLTVMGGVGYGIYTMALVELGGRFKGLALVAGNAAFALMWGLGGMIGPPVAGSLMQAVGPVGLPLVIAGLTGALVGFALYRAARRSAKG